MDSKKEYTLFIDKNKKTFTVYTKTSPSQLSQVVSYGVQRLENIIEFSGGNIKCYLENEHKFINIKDIMEGSNGSFENI